MDEKTLQAICAQLTELQLQIEALRQTTFDHLSPRARDLYRQLLDELYQHAPEWRESIRKGIREGILIQGLQDIGQGHLWELPPEDSKSS
jgi:recombinational DNA repair ATPase RecF